MKRTPIALTPDEYPSKLSHLFEGAKIYDSSCSREARVLFIDRENGLYLKSAPRGTLELESKMTSYFGKLGLGARVIDYFSEGGRDYMLTTKVSGEDCIEREYLAEPKRLCDTLAEIMLRLHSTPAPDCPVPDRTAAYIATAEHNYRTGNYDSSLFPDNFGYTSAEEAWCVVEQARASLARDTLIHGDFCLPNIMLNNWTFSGFIDVGNGGVSDRHIDIFWCTWSLFFNLGTNEYRDRFLDAYGRNNFNPDMLKAVAAFEVFE